MKQALHTTGEILIDAAIGAGGFGLLFTSIEAGLKILVGIGTCVLLYYRIKKARSENKRHIYPKKND